MSISSDWRKTTAKAGYSAKTVMYIMLGLFILTSVFSALNNEKASQSHVFFTLKQQPLGQIFLALLVVGLACYALWRWLQLFTGSKQDRDNRFVFLINKAFFFISGLFYLGAAYAGATTLLDVRGDEKEGNNSQEVSAYLMQYEWGIMLVASIGICVLIFAFVQFKHAYTGDFTDKFTLSSLNQFIQKSITVTGRLGYFARGTVYLLVGSFFVFAAILSNPSEAGGLEKALSTLVEQPFGPYLIAGVGIGFVMFGLYCALEAKYRDI